MPLELYKRDGEYWFRGRIDQIPGGKYYRRSAKASSEAQAQRNIAEFERAEIKRHYAGSEKVLTFAEAVLLYECNAKTAGYLEKILAHLADRPCAEISGKEVRDLARRIYAKASTDTWQRQVITPVSAVINNAHDDGNRCPPIRIKGFTRNERVAQDRKRGKASRQEKTPGDWPWIEAFRAAAREAGSPALAAMALLMFTKGCRVGQAVQLEPRDLDLQSGRLFMPAAKGHDAQWVEIPVELVVELANLTPRRPRQRITSHIAELQAAALKSLNTGGTGIAAFQGQGAPLEAHAVPSPTGGAPFVRWFQDGRRLTKKAAATIARTPANPRHPVRVFGFADHWSVEKKWRRICEDAGLEVRMPHAAGRHGFGTETISRLGIDPASAAAEGRWASPSVMLNRYAHAVEESAIVQEKIRNNRLVNL